MLGIARERQSMARSRKKHVNKQGHFFCSGCGTDRPYLDAVNDIIDGEALCYRCNQQLEVELGRGAPEKPKTRSTQDKVTAINTPLMNERIAEKILQDL